MAISAVRSLQRNAKEDVTLGIMARRKLKWYVCAARRHLIESAGERTFLPGLALKLLRIECYLRFLPVWYPGVAAFHEILTGICESHRLAKSDSLLKLGGSLNVVLTQEGTSYSRAWSPIA